MADDPRLILLRQAVAAAGSQAKVAVRLGYSAATISQAVHGNYQGSVETILERVEVVYGDRLVACPQLGDIRLGICVTERRRPFKATNPQRIRMHRACKQCPLNSDQK